MTEKPHGVPADDEIFVGGLPQFVTEETIRNYFEQWGEISKIAHKVGRGFTFVTFTDIATVDAVLENAEQHEIDGKWVECKRAENRRTSGEEWESKGKGKSSSPGKGGKGKGGGAGKGPYGKGSYGKGGGYGQSYGGGKKGDGYHKGGYGGGKGYNSKGGYGGKSGGKGGKGRPAPY